MAHQQLLRDKYCGTQDSRDFVHWTNNGREELVCHCPHVSDGGIQARPHLFVI